MEPATEIKNQTVLLASLRNDIIEASTALSQNLKDVKVKQEKLAEIEKDLAIKTIISQEEARHLGSLMDAQKVAVNTRIEAEEAVKRTKAEIGILKVQKKEALNELKRLNEWVYTAKLAEDELLAKKALLEANIAELKTEVAFLELAKKDAEAEYRAVVLEIKLALDSGKSELSQITLEVEKAQLVLVSTKKEQEKAEMAVLDADNKKRQIEIDLEIYTVRIKDEYEKTFPGRIMKL